MKILSLITVGTVGVVVSVSFAQTVTLPPSLAGDLFTEGRAGEAQQDNPVTVSEIAIGPIGQAQAESMIDVSGTVFDPVSMTNLVATSVVELDVGYAAGSGEFTLDGTAEANRGSGRFDGVVDLDVGILLKKPIPRQLPVAGLPGAFTETGSFVPVAVPIVTQFESEQTVDNGAGTQIRVGALAKFPDGTEIFQQVLLDGGVVPSGQPIADGSYELTYFVGSSRLTSIRLDVMGNVVDPGLGDELPASAQATATITMPTGRFDQALFNDRWSANFASPPIDLDEYVEVYSLGEVGILQQALIQPSLSINTSANFEDFQNLVGVAPISGEVRSDSGGSFARARGTAPDPNMSGGSVGVLAVADSPTLVLDDFERARAEAVLVERYRLEAAPGAPTFNGRTRVNVNLEFDGQITLTQPFVPTPNESSSSGELTVEFYVREADGGIRTIFLDTIIWDLRDNNLGFPTEFYNEYTEAVQRGDGTIFAINTTDPVDGAIATIDFDFDIDTSLLLLADSDLTIEARIIGLAEANRGGMASVDFFNTLGFTASGIDGQSMLTLLPPIPEPGVIGVFGLAVTLVRRRRSV